MDSSDWYRLYRPLPTPPVRVSGDRLDTTRTAVYPFAGHRLASGPIPDSAVQAELSSFCRQPVQFALGSTCSFAALCQFGAEQSVTIVKKGAKHLFNENSLL